MKDVSLTSLNVFYHDILHGENQLADEFEQLPEWNAHLKALVLIASQVRKFSDLQQPYRIYHGSTNSTREYTFNRDQTVDTSKLDHVLYVDTARKTALVEPNVPMDGLVQATLRYGLVPPVVMEFPGITVGGGFAGTSGESSSFKWGFFDSIVNWVVIVLPDGSVVRASRSEMPDLFYGAAGSFGTLGVTVLLEVSLIEAKQYVEVTYHPVTSISNAISAMMAATRDPSNDYVDGILFSKDRGVIVTGQLKDNVGDSASVQQFTRRQDPWFFIHAQRSTQTSFKSVKNAVPLVDYLFRYDRGGFWVGMSAFDYFFAPINWISRRLTFNRISRWLLDYFMHTRVMYHALHASGHGSQYIIQDLALPVQTANKFIEYVDTNFGIYPLWLCPLRQSETSLMHPDKPSIASDQGDGNAAFPVNLINVGVWGPGPTNRDKFIKVNRDIEQTVRDFGGQKWLYAHAYYTADEFWSIYDKRAYDALRAKYGASYLPDLYEKVRVDVAKERVRLATWRGWLLAVFWSIWPLSGLFGVLMTVLSRDYLLGA